MKIPNHIKHLCSFLSISGFILLLVLSPCKVRNSIQEVFEVPKTEVSNKSISALKNGTCNVSSTENTILSKSNINLQLSQALLVKPSLFKTNTIALSERSITQYYNARAEIPPVVPYYILFQNNKAYL
ncbi:hypothetical protein [Winogradskyella vidalii]|uniref:hypothetical protein n=1 Tax=Winogradskyella vidalii TaxID=2615024 RepID=UPI0015CAC7E7|nr:hypothetical protein [Winogradskyella vidalii]